MLSINRINLFMSVAKSDKSKSKSSFRRTTALQPLRETQLKVLAPIYDKVAILRQHMEETKLPLNSFASQDLMQPRTNQCFLQLTIDRNQKIQDIRKLHSSQQILSFRKKTVDNLHVQSTNNLQKHHRNRTKSLINFLHNTKAMPAIAKNFDKGKSSINNNDTLVRGSIGNEDGFEPMGEQYIRQKKYQESLKSQTFSVTSRQESSIKMSKIGVSVSKDQGKKYLRKGARVRELLMRQLQSPEERKSTPSSMTYLKDYDQWVPTTFVEEKKAELEAFMSVIYGQKRVKGAEEIDLDKLDLVYL